jgi:4-aminobutyrate aminotransferase-like enzyme
MGDLLDSIIKDSIGLGLLAAFLWLVLKQFKAILDDNKLFINKQTDALKETQQEYTKSLLEVVTNYEKNAVSIQNSMNETNEATKRIASLVEGIPDIKTTNNQFKESLAKTEKLIDEIKKTKIYESKAS